MNTYWIDTRIGWLGLREQDGALTQLSFGGDTPPENTGSPTPLLEMAERQLTEYLAGTRRAFELPLAPKGTDFQCAVWRELQQIPYGQTRTYQQIAKQVGNEKACRAVGLANNRNPIAIFIPCHRVIGSNGALTGYAGGLWMKRELLELEGILKR